MAMGQPSTAIVELDQSSATRGLSVLVVDDNVDCAETTAVLLSLFGHTARTATTGAEAIGAVCQQQFDVVLLDISLPGLTGHELATWIKGQTHLRQPVIIAVTGRADEATRRKSTECGIEHHLLKPVDPQYLKELLSRIPR
jgi:CheY-like chemotaxis protein